MDLKSRKSPRKSLNKSHSSNTYRKTKSPLPRSQSKKKIKPINAMHPPSEFKKKPQMKTLSKKKIDDLQVPDLIIKINYKGKRISIPLNNITDKNLKQTVIAHIVRFEKEILRNSQFRTSMIENWRTIHPSDILKDYYFQTGKSLQLFRGQVLEIEPIWRQPFESRISLKDFQIVKCIGTGGFSRVFLVRLKNNGKFYALKLMEKQGLFQSGKQCVVTNERDIMVDLDNPHILKLQFTFQTKHFVALGLQYCPGGELFFYLRKVRRMTEQQARYCFIQILLGIQYLHNKKIIYRDIKPENIMIDMDGNLKIADFGLSKIGLRHDQLAYTYCGSPQYMAPQMLSKSGHNYSVDYYCLGALLYELVTGNPPFYSRNVEKIYYSIQNQEIDFPQYVSLSPQIKMLLEGLLIKDPRRRLGSLGGVRQILGHPWVRKLKAAEVEEKAIPTPIHVDLLAFNINEQQVQDTENNKFQLKLQNEDEYFKPMFEEFYFVRNHPFNVLDDGFPSAKSQSTKQNKNENSKLILNPSKSRNQNKRPPSREKKSEIISPKHDSKMIQNSKTFLKSKKKNNSKKNLNLVERSKKRDFRQKSNHFKGTKRLMSPKAQKKNGLKRVKSSTALLGQQKGASLKIGKI